MRNSKFFRKATARTRLACLIKHLCERSKTGAVIVDAATLSKRLDVCEKTIWRATASIRGRDLIWLQRKGFLLIAFFERGTGATKKGRRRIMAVSAKTLASEKVWLAKGGATKHVRTSWGKGRVLVTPDYLQFLMDQAKTTRQLEPGFEFTAPAEGARSSGPRPSSHVTNREQRTSSGLWDRQTNHNKGRGPEDRAPSAGAVNSKPGFSSGRERNLAWFLGSRCLDLLSERGVSGANPGSVAGFCAKWVREGIDRETLWEAVQRATDIELREGAKSHPGLVMWKAGQILGEGIALGGLTRGQRIAAVYRKRAAIPAPVVAFSERLAAIPKMV